MILETIEDLGEQEFQVEKLCFNTSLWYGSVFKDI